MKNAIQPIRWRQRRKFTPEFKQDAVRMILVEGISLKETAEKLGIERSCLNRWKNKHLQTSRKSLIFSDNQDFQNKSLPSGTR